MGIQTKFAILLTLCGLAPYAATAQEDFRHPGPSRSAPHRISQKQLPAKAAMLSPDEGLSVTAAALDSNVRLHGKRDCSHLVHAIYERAGLPYSYAPSSSLYAGVEKFQRIPLPQPGDLVVWRGHVGVVVNPVQHLFFSFLRSGPGIDAYNSAYWKKRGPVRFYRYLVRELMHGTPARGRQLTRVRHDR